jgi:hypothetical protein
MADERTFEVGATETPPNIASYNDVRKKIEKYTTLEQ